MPHTQNRYGAFGQYDEDLLDNLTWPEQCSSCKVERECDELTLCLTTDKYFCEKCWLDQPDIVHSRVTGLFHRAVRQAAIGAAALIALYAVHPSWKPLAACLVLLHAAFMAMKEKSAWTSYLPAVCDLLAWDFWFQDPVREFTLFSTEQGTSLAICVLMIISGWRAISEIRKRVAA
jgi:K+-sensing histidine kinase KdpD